MSTQGWFFVGFVMGAVCGAVATIVIEALAKARDRQMKPWSEERRREMMIREQNKGG